MRHSISPSVVLPAAALLLFGAVAHAQEDPDAAEPVAEPAVDPAEKVATEPANEPEEAPAEEAPADEPPADEPPADEPVDEPDEDASVDRFRNPVQTLTEHFLASTSRPIRFDWRKSTVAVGFIGSELIERNNFGSFRTGGLVRKAFADVMVEVAVTWVFVFPTAASQTLSLTPYRQAGRPPRVEFDVNAAYPLVEAVVTPVLSWIPPAELVLNATGGFRYLLYYQSFEALEDQAALDIGAAIASPFVSEAELREIELTAPRGMLVDQGRYHVMAGLALDVYFQPGIFISPRAHLAIPILAAISATQLGLWWETSIVIGYAF